MSNTNNNQQQQQSWNTGMISVEAELQAVERDFYSGKCGAFETADAQQEVATQLARLKGFENDLFSRSKALWDWSNDEQNLWQSAMHRQQQGPNGSGSTPSATPSPGLNQQQQQQMTSADQLASLFSTRDKALRDVSDTVGQLAGSISLCCDVVSRGGGGGGATSSNTNNANISKNGPTNNNNAGGGSNSTMNNTTNNGSSSKQQSRTNSGQPGNRSSKSGNVVG